MPHAVRNAVVARVGEPVREGSSRKVNATRVATPFASLLCQ